MPQNTTKNILISVALIAFIVSSGAFTIYQLARRQTNTTNDSQSSLQSPSSYIGGIFNSTASSSSLNASQASAINSTTESTSLSQTEMKIESSAQSSPATEQSSQVASSSDLPKQLAEAPALPDNASSPTSPKSTTETTNNPNSIRSGGLDITAVFVVLMLILVSSLVAKSKTKNFNIKDIFGNK
jgi:cytoskeletal protein RodZ